MYSKQILLCHLVVLISVARTVLTVVNSVLVGHESVGQNGYQMSFEFPVEAPAST